MTFKQSVTLHVKLLSDRAQAPEYQTAGASGMDLYSCLAPDQKEWVIKPGDIALIPTGISIAVPAGYEGQVRARSGLATKNGLGLPNSPGTIDSDYRGEVKVALINWGREPVVIAHRMRIAQLVICPVARADIEVVHTLDATERGTGGFGSTGLV